MYKVWWWAKNNNFGDLLTKNLLDYYNIKFEFAESFKQANLISIGSIVSKARKNTHVLGSGILSLKERPTPNANYHFVRGPYTKRRIVELGGKCPEIYGDPAMLLPLFCEESKKEYDVGIVPHYVDYEYVKQTYPNYRIINVLNTDPLLVAKEITKCKKIISTSLHGIITAHAYNIPAAWVKFSDKLAGDDIKFYDHYASLGLEAELSTIDNPIFTTGKIDINPIINIFKELK